MEKCPADAGALGAHHCSFKDEHRHWERCDLKTKAKSLFSPFPVRSICSWRSFVKFILDWECLCPDYLQRGNLQTGLLMSRHMFMHVGSCRCPDTAISCRDHCCDPLVAVLLLETNQEETIIMFLLLCSQLVQSLFMPSFL